MKHYVLGFLFDEHKKWVLLIEKAKPEWQKGFLNGIGGKIEDFDKTPYDAMIREFQEETGLHVWDWSEFAILSSPHYKMHCFYSYAHLDYFNAYHSPTVEQVGAYMVSSLPQRKLCLIKQLHLEPLTLTNVQWLVPMALSFGEGEQAMGFNVQEIGHTASSEHDVQMAVNT